METLFNLDWRELVIPSTSVLEVVLRGTVVYLALFALLRFVVKREAGELAITDLLVLVLLADASQNALGGNYQSITEGLVLALTIIGWSLLLNWLSYASPYLERLLRPPPLLLVRNGRILRRNMRREFITDSELLGALREHGLEDVNQAKRVFMESDGQLSVVAYDHIQAAPRRHPR